MSIKQRVYSVLVVSAAEGFTNALCELLPPSKYDPVRTATGISAAKSALTEREYDHVIINAPLPDDAGTRFAIDTCNTKNAVVLLLVRAELHAEIYNKVAPHGVFTLPKPTSKAAMTMALSWMSGARERLRKYEKKTVSIEKKMEELRIVNKAKWLLIGQLHMQEPEAHRYIEKQAMDQCVSKRTVAEEIIKTHSS